MTKKIITVSMFLFSLSLFHSFTPSSAHAQEGCQATPSTNVGPELAEYQAGEAVIAAQNFNGAVSVINYLNQGHTTAQNTVPRKDLNPISVLRVDINADTPDENIIAWAESLNANHTTEFPCGIKVIVVSVEMNNLDWWFNIPGYWENEYQKLNIAQQNAQIIAAGDNYGQKFALLADTLNVPYPVAPAPPDMFNPRYSSELWINGFAHSGACGFVDANVADIFEVPTTGSPIGSGQYDWLSIYQYQAEKMCGKPVIHFEGWGGHPSLDVKAQVEWYKSHNHLIPSEVGTATTLIVPNCNGERVYPYFWYYLNGKVFTPDGKEIDPESCGGTSFRPATDTPNYCVSYDDGLDHKSVTEFHSLRPYPACPRYQEVAQTNFFLCGHDLIATETITLNSPTENPANTTRTCSPPNANGDIECEYEVTDRSVRVDVDLSETKLPILGLTEGPYVNNSEYRAKGSLSDAQKLSEYVSWYLNGATNRAEGNFLKYLESYPEGADDNPKAYADTRRLIDFSGPLKKLLPLRIQTNKRVEQIERALDTYNISVDTLGEAARHDQIVACYYEMPTSLGVLGILEEAGQWFLHNLSLGLAGDSNFVNTLEKIPGPCYPEEEIPTINIDIPLIGINIVDQPLITIKQMHLTTWANENKLPPKREDYRDFPEYWLDYQIWRGKFCPGTKFLRDLGWESAPLIYLCYDDPLDLARPNFWGALFPYIPMSSTEDRVGLAEADLTLTNQPSSDLKETAAKFVPDKLEGAESGKRHFLFFPHVQESTELGALTQGMFVPGADPEFRSESDRWLKPGAFYTENNQWLYNTDRCEIVESRTNPGDDLYGEKTRQFDFAPEGPFGINEVDDLTIGGDLLYSGTFTCKFTYNPVSDTYSPCEIHASSGLSLYSITPKVEEIWERFVAGPMSIFKRFYPKFGPNTPIESLKDIPAESNINLSSSVKTTAGDAYSGRPGDQAKIYFPHLGSVYDYFLKGIQEALLPQGMTTQSGSVSDPPPADADPAIYESIACPTNIPPLQSYIPGILCSIEGICTATAADVPSQYLGPIKAKAIDLARRWIDPYPGEETNNSNIEACYYETVKRSLSAGINPIYSLAIWIQESDASNYDSSVTTCDPTDPTNTLQDFGINDISIAGNFDAQSKRFMHLPYLYPVDYPQCFPSGCNIATFSRVYRRGTSASCELNTGDIGYANKTLRAMKAISPNCQPKYPTDMSCP